MLLQDITELYYAMDKLGQAKHLQCLVLQIILNKEELFLELFNNFITKSLINLIKLLLLESVILKFIMKE
jgi:hypothetical protein